MTKIYRYEIPVDDRWHDLELTGEILHVATRHRDIVEIWAISGTTPPTSRRFRVYGTGQQLPDKPFTWRGTAFADHGTLVWHLIETNAGAPA